MSEPLSNEYSIHAAATELIAANRIAEARQLLQQLVDAGSVNPEVYNDLGTACFSLGETDQAVQWLRVAADLDFSSTLALRNLVAVYASTGHVAEAIGALSLIVRRDSADDAVIEVMIALLKESNPRLDDLAWLSPTIAAVQDERASLRKENERLHGELESLQARLANLDTATAPATAEEIASYCQSEADACGVLAEVHPEDFIFAFFTNHPAFVGNPREAVRRYFDSGRMSTNNLRQALFTDLGFARGKPLRLLEFASGYGCVTRHLIRYPDELDVVACDIHPEAMDFIRDKLHGNCLLSETVPEDFPQVAPFDAVFALSFFSHMPERTWGRWLAALYRSIRPGGCLLFTTHGLASARMLGNPVLSEEGFWFKPISEQHDLEGADYGSTLTTPQYVRRQIEQLPNAALALCREAYWWGHQDFWAVRKLSP
ncbi:MAG: methyltransferase domain-containing protein [Rhodocyclales bacterium]|nr:methyltransferase domain-containing protein [Rhodocyclales bacterium]